MSGSSGGATVLREFLVSIGYQETGRKQFSDNMIVVANQAVELGKTMARAAQDVVEAVGRMSAALEDLYFQSQRTRATVESINAIGFAASQMGSSVAGARGTIEAFGRFMRTNPGGENFLSGLGVATRDANGNLRETGDLLKQTIRVLNTKQPGVAMAYASVLGIDEKTLLGLTAEAEKFDAISRRMYKAAGVDQQKAAKDSHLLEVEFRTLGEAVTVLSTKFISLLAPRFTADVRRWREVIEQNFGPITRALQWIADKVLLVVNVFTKLFVSAVQIVSGIAYAWGRLDPESKKLIGIFAAIVVAWRLMNAAFLLSPWGVVIALGAAILALYDDYKVWEQHGKSLIDWGKWKGEIDAAKAGIKSLAEPFHDLSLAVQNLIRAIEQLVKANGLDGMFSLDLIKRIETTAREMRGIIGYVTDVVRLYTALAQRNIFGENGVIAVAQEMKDRYLDTPEMKKNREETHQRQQQQYGGYSAGGAYAGESMLGGFWRRNAPRLLGGGGAAAPAGTGTGAQGDPHGPRGIRNNNPLNLEFRQGQVGLDPARPSDGRFGRYADMEAGVAAAHRQLQLYQRRDGLVTVGNMINRWAPPSENDTGAYARQVAARMNIGVNQPFNVNDPALATAMIDAMARVENGRAVDRATIAAGVSRNLGIPTNIPPADRPAPFPALVPPPEPATTSAPGFLSWMRGGRVPAVVPPPDATVRIDKERLFDDFEKHLRTPRGPAPTDDTAIKVDPDYLRNRNAPVTYPAPLLDVPPLGAPANTNINTSSVAPVINQTTNIHLTGGPDQNRQVLDGQQGVNERLVRNLSSAAR